MGEPTQVTQIRQWLAGEIHVDHDTFTFGREYGAALVEAFDERATEQLQAADAKTFRLEAELRTLRSAVWRLVHEVGDTGIVYTEGDAVHCGDDEADAVARALRENGR